MRWLALLVALLAASALFCGGSSSDYHERTVRVHQLVDQQAPPGAVYFLGDSITAALWTPSVTPLGVNYGIGSDTVEGLLARLPNYQSMATAKAIVLEIAVNDLTQRSDDAILADYERLLHSLPDVPVIVCGVLPVDEAACQSVDNSRIDGFNRLLKTLCTGSRHYMACPQLADARGQLRHHTGDGLHFNAEGYAVWSAAISEALSQ